MKAFRLTLFTLSIAVGALVLQVERTHAQVPPNLIYINSSGAGGTIQVTVDLDINGTLPTEWSGWVIDRVTVGDCDQSTVQVGNVTPFPVGAQIYHFTDGEASPEFTYRYIFYAVDNGGVRYGVPHTLDFGFLTTSYASIDDIGRVAKGYLFDTGWGIGVAVCPGECWVSISSIPNPPSLFHFMLDGSAPVQISGKIEIGVEGPYISQVTSWSILSDCSAVDNVPISWGEMKALYR